MTNFENCIQNAKEIWFSSNGAEKNVPGTFMKAVNFRHRNIPLRGCYFSKQILALSLGLKHYQGDISCFNHIFLLKSGIKLVSPFDVDNLESRGMDMVCKGYILLVMEHIKMWNVKKIKFFSLFCLPGLGAQSWAS